MVALNCPLCCNEIFSSHTSLKCHILSILDNLECPSCHRKFNKLCELAEHLEINCSEESVSADSSGHITKRDFEKLESNEVHQGSILARALLGSTQHNANSKVDEEETQYYCQMCDMHFDDIEGHLNQFHEGQEIILEEDGGTESNEADVVDTETIFIIDASSPTSPQNKDYEDIETDVCEATLKTSSGKKLNTICEENFKDKDGRLYTRKFVKIDQFWLQKDPHQKLEKSSNENEVLNKNSIIEADKCRTCNVHFSSSELYQNHKCTNSDELKCNHCSCSFEDVDSLQEHLKVHVEDKKWAVAPFNCEVCNTTFSTFKSLRLHRRMHDPIKAREIEAPSKYGLFENDVSEEQVRQMFICKICNKTYDKQYEFIHTNSHNANNGFNCDVCNRKFFTQSNLDMHMKAHSNNKKFTCSYCKKPFVTYDALNEHLLNQCQKRPYACQFCGRRFARPHEKVKHERIHTGEKPHVCDICGKAFRVSYCLTLHLRTHSGTRPYQCKDCGKRFKSHSVYNHHLLTHSDVRAYKCPYCPKAFKTSVQLAGHKNSHIKPFTCTECNRPFASLYAVRAHMETHKKDNNLKYECWMCGALYSRAFALRDHQKQQHQQMEEEMKAVALGVEEEMEAASSILVSEDDILGLDGDTNIETIENSGE